MNSKCPNCIETVESEYDNCPACKRKLVEFYCIDCGKRLADPYTFNCCPYCGKKFDTYARVWNNMLLYFPDKIRKT